MNMLIIYHSHPGILLHPHGLLEIKLHESKDLCCPVPCFVPNMLMHK